MLFGERRNVWDPIQFKQILANEYNYKFLNQRILPTEILP